MGIKNFFVKVETVREEVKGLRKIIKYYDSEDFPSHKGRTTIIQLYKNNNFFDNVVKSVSQKNTDLTLKGKGGRPIKVYGYSYCFGTPKGIKVSKEQWSQIFNDLLSVISKKSGLTITQLKPYLKFNIHDQDNSHLNILIGSVIDDKKIDFGRNEYLNLLKNQFNLSCFNILGLNHKTYETQTPKIVNMEKPKTRNIYQFKQLDEQYSKKVEKLVEIDKKTKSYIKKLTYHIKKILMKDEELKHYKELEKKIDKLPEITQKEIKQLIKDEYSLSME
jgi:hypothetical protein